MVSKFKIIESCSQYFQSYRNRDFLNAHFYFIVDDGPKIASYNEAIAKLEKVYEEHSEIDAKIDENMNELWKWSKINKRKRTEIKEEVENALDLLKSEKVRISSFPASQALKKLQVDSNLKNVNFWKSFLLEIGKNAPIGESQVFPFK